VSESTTYVRIVPHPAGQKVLTEAIEADVAPGWRLTPISGMTGDATSCSAMATSPSAPSRPASDPSRSGSPRVHDRRPAEQWEHGDPAAIPTEDPEPGGLILWLYQARDRLRCECRAGFRFDRELRLLTLSAWGHAAVRPGRRRPSAEGEPEA
jgi:hypothetical protein